jgi:hypothetical protein
LPLRYCIDTVPPQESTEGDPDQGTAFPENFGSGVPWLRSPYFVKTASCRENIDEKDYICPVLNFKFTYHLLVRKIFDFAR